MNRRPAGPLLALMTLAAAMAGPAVPGCSGDTPSGDPGARPDGPAPDGGEPDDGGPLPGDTAGPAPDAGGGQGVAATRLAVTLTPRRIAYPVGSRVTPHAVLLDGQGQELGEARNVAWSVDPPGMASPESGRLVFWREGRLRVQACVARPGGGDLLCGFTWALVDDGPPALEVTSPRPAEVLDGWATPTIQVTGKATDTHGTPRVWVNGTEVALDEEGRFTHGIVPRFGLNRIHVLADDGVNPASRDVDFFVLWAPDFLPVAAQGKSLLAPSALFWIGRSFLDGDVAGAPPGLPGPGGGEVVRVGDLADTLDLILTHADLLRFIPDPVLQGDVIDLRIPAAGVREVETDLDVVPDGLDLFLRVTVGLDTVGSLRYEGLSYDLRGEVTGTAAGSARLRFQRESPEAPVILELTSLGVAIESLVGHFRDGRVAAVFELGTSLLRGTVESAVEDIVSEMVRREVPGLLERAVQLLEAGMQGREVSLDIGVGEPISMVLDFTIARIELDPGVGLALLLDVGVGMPVQEGWLRRCPGAPLSRNRQAAPFPPPADVPASLALRLDAVNTVLHRLWAAGVLAIDVTGMVPPELQGVFSAIRLAGQLPPVVAPSSPDVGGLLEVQVGELDLELDHPAGTDVFSVTLRQSVHLELTSEHLVLALEGDPRLAVRLVQAAGQTPVVPPEVLHGMALTVLWPKVIERIGPGLEYPLPTFPLTGVAAIAPDLADLTFRLDVPDRGLEVRGNVLIAQGGMAAELVPSLPSAPSPGP